MFNRRDDRMTVEKALYEIIDLPELELPTNIKNIRYLKAIGKFYATLIDGNPSPLYDQPTSYHVDYIDDLLTVEESFNNKDYEQTLSLIKTLILSKKGYILQGRMFYNLQDIFERHIKDVLLEHLNPFELQVKSLSETNIFECRLNKDEKSALRNQFSKALTPILEEKKEQEYNRFKEILEKWQVDEGDTNKEQLNIIFDFIKKDIKTDPFTLVLFHDDPVGQYQVIKISREKEFPYEDYAMLHTNGSNFYLPDNRPFQQVKDFRFAMLITILQKQ